MAPNSLFNFVFLEFISPILSVSPDHNKTENKKAGVKGNPLFTLASEFDKALRIKDLCFSLEHCFSVTGNKNFKIWNSRRAIKLFLAFPLIRMSHLLKV